MSRLWSAVAVLLVVEVLASPGAWAGAKLEINEDAYLDLGFRVQALAVHTDEDIDGDGALDTEQFFKLRRGRFRLKGVVNDKFSAFLQTDVSSSSGGSGIDMRVIDAHINYRFGGWAELVAGLHMAPASRQNLTSSGALMAIDRPGINYKTLSWDARALARFSNSTYPGSASGLSAPVAVRDLGITLFGSGKLSDTLHLKYYLGMYDGIQAETSDNERITGRVQVNLFDAEGGYWNSSTYVGKKKTIGLGASFDSQSEVATDDASGLVDYAFFTVDVFGELPVGAGTLTFEAALESLDFDDAAGFEQSQGSGFYVQAGYLVGKTWQPWALYETWASDASNDLGSLSSFRVGVTYFIDGHNANFKLGYESFQTDVPLVGDEDTINTVVLGFFATY